MFNSGQLRELENALHTAGIVKVVDHPLGGHMVLSRVNVKRLEHKVDLLMEHLGVEYSTQAHLVEKDGAE